MRRFVLVVVVALVVMADPAWATPGQLDASFDGDGRVVTPFDAERDDLAEAVLALPGNGKIVAVGHVWRGTHYDFALARYLPSGSLDSTFDGDGKVTTNLNGRCSKAIPCSSDLAFDAARDSAGRIVVVGQSFGDVAIVRYEANGALDPTFDGDGRLWTDLGSTNEAARGVAIQADGRIVVVASAAGGAGTDIVVLRYNPNGQLDPTFDGNGIKFLDFGDREAAADVAIQPGNQKIVVLGYQGVGTASDFVFVRLGTGGALDGTFSGDGLHILSVDDLDSPEELAIQQDGRIVVVGTSYESGAAGTYVSVVRLTGNGAPDMGFGTGGIVRHDATAGTDLGLAVALQASGKTQKVVVAGLAGSSTLVTRYLPTGAPDPTWTSGGDGGDPGVVTQFFPGSTGSLAKAIAIQGDGKVVTAGHAAWGDADFALLRFLNA